MEVIGFILFLCGVFLAAAIGSIPTLILGGLLCFIGQFFPPFMYIGAVLVLVGVVSIMIGK